MWYNFSMKRKFETPEDLQHAVDDYLANTKVDDRTITGLALGLGFCDRQSLYDYDKYPNFSCIIKRARLHIENSYECQLKTQYSSGAIFALKNMGWKDRNDNNQSKEAVLTWI